jgi:hypothetical protein
MRPELPDHGHYYRETDLSHFIVEPWNAWSSLTFLIPALYFIWQISRSGNRHQFIFWVACPLLIIGGLGSTFYHAFRASIWLILADVIPILALVLAVSIRTWIKVLKPKWLVIPITILFFLLSFGIMRFFSDQDRVTASYVVRGTMLLLPFILYLRKPEVKMKIYVLYTMIALGAALIFRYVDEKLIISWMPWGTHWLWHVSTAVAAWFLGEFIIRNDQIETDPK